MQITNEWVDMGIEQGLAKGLAKGRSEVVLRQLRRRFGELPPEFPERIGHLASAHVDDLAEALLDFKSVDDLKAWLASIP